MNVNSFGTRVQQIIVMVLVVILVTLVVFYGYLPDNYNYKVGSVAESDVYATRTLTDTYQTEYEAMIAKNNVAAIFVRDERLSASNVDNVETFFNNVAQTRNLMNSGDAGAFITENIAVQNLNSTLKSALNKKFDPDDLLVFLKMTKSAFGYIEDKAISMTDVMMHGNVNADSLPTVIADQINSFKETNPSYSLYADSLSNVLTKIIEPNSVFDESATEDAQDNAYRAAVDNPVIIERGAKIVGAGEVITDHTYRLLYDLDLISTAGFDYFILARVAAYILLIFIACVFYISIKEVDFNIDLSVFYILIITFLIPITAGIYLSEISSLLVIELFFTTICATYMGISASIIFSVANLMMLWPIYDFDIETMFIQLVAIFVCSCIAGSRKNTFNTALIIIFPAFAALLASLAYNFFSNASRSDYIDSAMMTSLSAVGSLVIAVGLFPIYELFSRRVTPVRLIELSQPGHPLLKRLFIEASGTYQHSMTVANLADSAAEAIGADALLCKVACYYHDIGKLEHPEYFTENQHDGVNPHDTLTVMESVKIITAHTDDGIKLARKNKIPEQIIKVIDEHHGTTYPGYFYNKACEEAKAAGLDMPDVNNFRYKGHVPSSKESAIVMLADTCEAAVRSSGKTDLDSCEALIRRLVKGKIEQDQLVNSGLSFDDIEKIIESFKKYYAGAFHERIKYPENVN
ncbi:MAG: HDIG domain-containing protein [Saccharofermentans sp.]|nr:HDIG domain-containing protein [Saccharofermentans sp.]